ncbi:hypothetical protein ACGGAQ_32535 [Micromonospora sp. NPDC047557]|uniref:hypothetical protein n=1 Tax=Micromonospora sp. NPDC047557 TaxID=3364250 RepID=UPI003720EBDE
MDQIDRRTSLYSMQRRRQPDNPAFRKAVFAPRATNGKIRKRLKTLDDAVAAAAAQGGIPLPDTTTRDALTWQLLKALRIIELRLEGDDQADRTGVVSRLVSLVGDSPRAAAVWRRLRELSAEYAQTAATVTYDMVVRDVATVVPIAPLTPALVVVSARDEQMYERLRQLPALNGPRLLAAWRDERASLVEVPAPLAGAGSFCAGPAGATGGRGVVMIASLSEGRARAPVSGCAGGGYRTAETGGANLCRPGRVGQVGNQPRWCWKGYGDASGRRWCVRVGVGIARAVSAPTMEPGAVLSIESNGRVGAGLRGAG